MVDYIDMFLDNKTLNNTRKATIWISIIYSILISLFLLLSLINTLRNISSSRAYKLSLVFKFLLFLFALSTLIITSLDLYYQDDDKLFLTSLIMNISLVVSIAVISIIILTMVGCMEKVFSGYKVMYFKAMIYLINAIGLVYIILRGINLNA